MREKFQKTIIFTLLCSMLCIFTGCGANELEETAFPLLVAVDYEDDQNKVIYCNGFSRPSEESSGGKEFPYASRRGDTFALAKETYEDLLQKVPDYNHLKILLLGEDFVKNQQAYQNMLDTLAETEQFPRNTYVCITDEISDILEIADKLPEDVGSYLENYLENHKKEENNLISLGDLIDEQENQKLVLYAPYFEVEDDVVQMRGEYGIEFYD